jgi:ABC-2 type transport system permease protein
MNNLIAFQSIARKEVKRVFRIWIQTIIPSVINATLYFLIFWAFIGSKVQEVSGVPYIQFLVPWFIMMSVITASYMNVSSSFFGAKFQKSIEEILTSPIPGYIVILWFISGGIVRGTTIAVAIYIIAQFFTHIVPQHIFITLVFLLFTTSLFSLLGLFNAFFAKNFDQVNLIPTFVITPLVYLGGVFYPIASLPWFWKTISMLNPIYYMINGFRYGFLWLTEVNAYASLSAIIICNILLFWLNLWMFKQWKWLKN